MLIAPNSPPLKSRARPAPDDRVRSGAARRTARDGEGRRGTARDREGRRGTARDGEGRRGTERDGEGRRGTARDGEGRRGTERDGEGRRGTERDGCTTSDSKLLGQLASSIARQPIAPASDRRRRAVSATFHSGVFRSDSRTTVPAEAGAFYARKTRVRLLLRPVGGVSGSAPAAESTFVRQAASEKIATPNEASLAVRLVQKRLAACCTLTAVC